MVELKSLKLNQLGQSELLAKEMAQLMGGNVCVCTCPGPSSTYWNGKANIAYDYTASGDGNGTCSCFCHVSLENMERGGYAARY